MSGWQALGAGLLGAVQGGADVAQSIFAKRIQDDADLKKQRSLLELQDEIQQKRDARLKAMKAEENKRVQSTAESLAGAERNAQMDTARDIYQKSGMSQEDIDLGVAATEEARKGAKPEREHYMGALQQEGLLSAADVVKDMDATEATAYSRGRDAAEDKRKDRDFALRERQFNQTAANNALQYKINALTLKRAQEEDKIPPAEMRAYQTMQERVKLIDSEITKAKASGMFDPSSEAAQALVDEQASILKSMNSLLAPYLTDASRKVLSGKIEKEDPDDNPVYGKAPAAAAKAVAAEKPTPKQTVAPASPTQPRAMNDIDQIKAARAAKIAAIEKQIAGLSAQANVAYKAGDANAVKAISQQIGALQKQADAMRAGR